jgi:2,4-dienoyl-CoA reductase-like NADH-dependent reductase (Old Yellow Enzyme family)
VRSTLQLFSEESIGPIKLRNRSIRAAAYEGMCPGHLVSEDLIRYHRSVAAGGIGMTTVAYASVMQNGLSFPKQLWLRKEAVPGMRSLTDAVHAEGAAVSVQIGHCGNMASYSLSKGFPIAPSGGFNLYGPTFPRTMRQKDIGEAVKSFSDAVQIARESGFDAVEVHAGHGYLISQFLSPYTNRRKDEYGGSFENRSRFMRELMESVMQAAGKDMGVVVKMNLRDGFSGGMEIGEAVEVAKQLERSGAHALVLSGGFVSRAPMYVMRGRMPFRVMSHGVRNPVTRVLIRVFGGMLVRPEPFHEAYFLEDALRVRAAVKLPLVFVGGLETIEKVLGQGFEFVAFARPLVNDPAFISKLKTGEITRSECTTANYCVAAIYTGKMACHQHLDDLPEKLRRELAD